MCGTSRDDNLFENSKHKSKLASTAGIIVSGRHFGPTRTSSPDESIVQSLLFSEWLLSK
jgi:hypothetical protein